MGAGVSAGENNDDLIDNLIEANYIKTAFVEKIFRAVDRGAYFLPDPPTDAYRDVAWKNGNFHISAPCIYSEVVEGLKLRPGLSFLNLGSGTGYLNTIAGLILGSYGINHGIELHEEVIRYAYMRLEEFKKHSGAIDEYDFCEPKFMQGNCLCLASGYPLYDRVYCGAACPEKYMSYMKNLMKVGGILVIPVNERLIEMRRVAETSWTTHYLLPVSFTNLVRPDSLSQEVVSCFDIEPLSLQELCRTSIRNILRKNVEAEHPKVRKIRKKQRFLKKKRTLKRDRNGRKDTPKASDELLDFFLLTIARKKKRVSAGVARERENSSSSARDSDGVSSDSDGSLTEDSERTQEAFNNLNGNFYQSQATTSNNNSHSNDVDEASSSKQTVDEDETDRKVIVHREDVDETDDDQIETKVSYNVMVKPMVVEEAVVEEKKTEMEGKQKNRDKFDSGLGDELIISEVPVEMVETVSTSSEDEEDKRINKGLRDKEKRFITKCRNIDRFDKLREKQRFSSDEEFKTDSDSENIKAMHKMKMYISPYTVHMRRKIQQLPLPSNVKKFLNYYREF